MLLPGCATCTLTHIIGTRNNLQETPKIRKGGIFSRFVNPKLWRKKASPCFLSQPVVHRQSRYEVHTYLHSDFCLLFSCWTFRLHSINGGISHSNRETKGGKGIFKKLSLHKKCLSFIWFKIFFGRQIEFGYMPLRHHGDTGWQNLAAFRREQKWQ